MSNTTPIRVSAVIKAKNEERNIGDCLRSAELLADEFIVVDDGSTDKTREIALGLGANVIAAQSQNGVIDVLDKIGFQAAKGEWLLRLDADERLTPSLASKLREAASAGRWAGVRFARQNFMFGAVARHGGWFQADQLRFFRADCWDKAWDAAPHTQPTVTGDILTLAPLVELATLHYDYDSVEEFIHRTLLGYAKTEAMEIKRKGGKFSLRRLIIRPPKIFLGRLLIRGGWRDGVRGIVLAGLLACYAFLIEAILWDSERAER